MNYKDVRYYLETARSRLGDTADSSSNTRWSTPLLLGLLNEGLEYLASNYRFFQREKLVPLVLGQAHYDLTDFAYEVSRVEINGCRVPFVSHHELDLVVPCCGTCRWPNMIGEPVAVIYDHLDAGRIRVFPYLSSELDGLDGVDPVITTQMRVFYRERQPTYELSTQKVILDAKLERALVYFIVSEALLVGEDSENRNLSETFQTKMMRILGPLDEDSDAQTDRMLHSDYNNGFNLDYPDSSALLRGKRFPCSSTPPAEPVYADITPRVRVAWDMNFPASGSNIVIPDSSGNSGPELHVTTSGTAQGPSLLPAGTGSIGEATFVAGGGATVSPALVLGDTFAFETVFQLSGPHPTSPIWSGGTTWLGYLLTDLVLVVNGITHTIATDLTGVVHAVITSDMGTWQLWINGERRAAGTGMNFTLDQLGTVPAPTGVVSDGFIGVVDNTKVYYNPLLASEVATLYEEFQG